LTDARCRVTVIGAENRVDLAIPAEAPIAEYNDLLARMCGQPQDDALPPVWSLAPVGRAPFALTSSLALEGVEDGAILYLRDTLADEAQEPVVHSVWELVSDFAEESRGIRWNARAAGRVAVILGAYWIAVAVGYLGFTGHRSGGLGVIGGVLGLGLAILARVLRQHPRVLPGTLRSALGCAVIPCTVLVAFFGPGPPALDAIHLVSLEVGLLLGFLIALIAVPGVLVGASTLLVAIAGVLITVLVSVHATAPAVAATVVVAGVLFVAIAPRTAGMLVAATWLSMSSSTLEPEADSDRLAERFRQAHRALVLLVGVTSAAVAIALAVLTRGSSPFTLAVAITATMVLLLRTRTFALASEAVGPVVAAITGLFGLLTMLARSGTTDAYVLPALFLVGVAAVAVGVPVLLWGSGRAPAPDDKQPLNPLLTIGQIVLPALLLGVYGLYTTLWNLGR
jgi:type VII secretion integral membrane protein EccD